MGGKGKIGQVLDFFGRPKAEIANLVVNLGLARRIPLSALAHLGKYNSKVFAAMTVTTSDNSGCFLIFDKGTVTYVGPKNPLDALIQVYRLRNLLLRAKGVSTVICDYQINNVVMPGFTGFKILLEDFRRFAGEQKDLHQMFNYDPTGFSGMFVKYAGVTVIFYETGTFVVVGASSIKDAKRRVIFAYLMALKWYYSRFPKK